MVFSRALFGFSIFPVFFFGTFLMVGQEGSRGLRCSANSGDSSCFWPF